MLCSCFAMEDRIIVLFVLVVILTPYEVTGDFPDSTLFMSWARNVGAVLQGKVYNATAFASLSKTYTAYDPSKVNFKRTDCLSLVLESAAELEQKLEGKLAALNESVRQAEELAANYIEVIKIQRSDIEFVNAKDIEENDPTLQWSDRFKDNVSLDYSSVHIPLEIWEEDPEILNGLNWSRGMDEMFRHNIEHDHSIMWQYFGSQTGFMRTFPASKWYIPDDEPDMFDVRRRPWYIQGSSSPKNVLLLIDTSGSTSGQTIGLMKVTVNSILDTLVEDDFVLAMEFNAYTRFVGCPFDGEDEFTHEQFEEAGCCFNTFKQADDRNKKAISAAVSVLKSQNQANYQIGFKAAFEQFIKFRQTEASMSQGSDCNEVIMLLTDGGMEYPEAIFKEYNPKKTVRIFTFAIGPAATPIAAPRRIACTNRGYFTKIPSMGAIRSKVQEALQLVMGRPLALEKAYHLLWAGPYVSDPHREYVEVLSRPMVISREKHYLWTNVYLDALAWLIANKHLHSGGEMATTSNMGMITTVTLPVYNVSYASDNQTILGVMGLDVSTNEMIGCLPHRKLGPNGYGFAINPNGFVLFHPNMKGQVGYLTDPPSLDFLEVEIENEHKVVLRKDMIDKGTSTKVIDTIVVSTDQKHAQRRTHTYCYTTIKNADFSLALVVPEENQFELLIKGYEEEKGILYEPASNITLLLAPLQYCEDYDTTGHPADGIAALDELLRLEYSCEEDLIQNLLWDLELMSRSDIDKLWKLAAYVGHHGNVRSVFAATNSGLTRLFPSSFAHLHEVHNLKASYYTRALATDETVYLATYPDDAGYNIEDPIITIVKAVQIQVPEGGVSKPSVIGAKVTPDFLVTTMLLHTECVGDDIVCYLLDDGGFLLAASLAIDVDDENATDSAAPPTGAFLGMLDPSLMQQLYRDGVFVREQQYDFQALCTVEEDLTSAGVASAYIPSLSMAASRLQWVAQQAARSYVGLNLYSAATGWLKSARAENLDPESEVTEENCIKMAVQYRYGPNSTASSGTFNCSTDDCPRSYHSGRIVETNLLLVVVEPPPINCTCDVAPISVEPERVPGPNVCEAQPRYRRRPANCYSQSQKEDVSPCAGVALQPPSLLLLLLLLLPLTVCATMGAGSTHDISSH